MITTCVVQTPAILITDVSTPGMSLVMIMMFVLLILVAQLKDVSIPLSIVMIIMLVRRIAVILRKVANIRLSLVMIKTLVPKIDVTK